MAARADVGTAFGQDPPRAAILETAGTARMGQVSAATQLETARRLRENAIGRATRSSAQCAAAAAASASG